MLWFCESWDLGCRWKLLDHCVGKDSPLLSYERQFWHVAMVALCCIQSYVMYFQQFGNYMQVLLSIFAMRPQL